MSASPPRDASNNEDNDKRDNLARSTHAFCLSARMITIRLKSSVLQTEESQ